MKNIRVFYLNIFQFLEVKFSIYLNRRVFVMYFCGAYKSYKHQPNDELSCPDIFYTWRSAIWTYRTSLTVKLFLEYRSRIFSSTGRYVSAGHLVIDVEVTNFVDLRNKTENGYMFRNNPKYWDEKVLSNSADTDQRPQNVVSDLDLQKCCVWSGSTLFATNLAVFWYINKQ